MSRLDLPRGSLGYSPCPRRGPLRRESEAEPPDHACDSWCHPGRAKLGLRNSRRRPRALRRPDEGQPAHTIPHHLGDFHSYPRPLGRLSRARGPRTGVGRRADDLCPGDPGPRCAAADLPRARSCPRRGTGAARLSGRGTQAAPRPARQGDFSQQAPTPSGKSVLKGHP